MNISKTQKMLTDFEIIVYRISIRNTKININQWIHTGFHFFLEEIFCYLWLATG